MTKKTTSLTRAGIVIVNYNSAELALTAALSVLGAAQCAEKARVVIVDNASPDRSFDQLVGIAQGQQVFFEPAVVAGVQLARLESLKIAAGIIRRGRIRPLFGEPEDADLVLIRSETNGGFAAGCNIGLAFLKKTDTDHFLLLNPDTQLDSQALQTFAGKLENPDYGLVGASLLGMDRPHEAQALGGAAFSPITLLGDNLGAGCLKEDMPPEEEIEQRLAYPVGAAMAFRRDWLESAGLLDERYFLFYEEIDWAMAGGKKYKTGWAREAFVYHHRGGRCGQSSCSTTS